MTIAQLTSRT